MELYIEAEQDSELPSSHPFAGYYLPYPDEKFEGLVSTISDKPPVLNWIYVDTETFEVKYGVRANAQQNLHGPFDCTRQDRRLTFDGWEGFCAVEVKPSRWALYFDHNDNGLQGKVPISTRILEIELSRSDKRLRKQYTEGDTGQSMQHEEEKTESVEERTPLASITVEVVKFDDEEKEEPKRQQKEPIEVKTPTDSRSVFKDSSRWLAEMTTRFPLPPSPETASQPKFRPPPIYLKTTTSQKPQVLQSSPTIPVSPIYPTSISPTMVPGPLFVPREHRRRFSVSSTLTSTPTVSTFEQFSEVRSPNPLPTLPVT
jgi:hypothetical protein